MTNTRIHHVDLRSGIRRARGFEKKGLATHSANVGLKCNHDCTYCSTGACNRCHEAFRCQGENPYEFGYAIIAPNILEKLAADAAGLQTSAVVQMSTSGDAWAQPRRRRATQKKARARLPFPVEGRTRNERFN